MARGERLMLRARGHHRPDNSPDLPSVSAEIVGECRTIVVCRVQRAVDGPHAAVTRPPTALAAMSPEKLTTRVSDGRRTPVERSYGAHGDIHRRPALGWGGREERT